MSHPSRRLDDTVHQRTRLGILAVLCESGGADFTYLRDALELTDGNLSRNLTRLQEAGYLTADKRMERGRTRTWLAPTGAGREALHTELAALRDLIERVGGGDRAGGEDRRAGDGGSAAGRGADAAPGRAPRVRPAPRVDPALGGAG